MNVKILNMLVEWKRRLFIFERSNLHIVFIWLWLRKIDEMKFDAEKAFNSCLNVFQA